MSSQRRLQQTTRILHNTNFNKKNQEVSFSANTSRVRNVQNLFIHCKKRLAGLPSPSGMSLTKLSLDGNYLIIPAWESLVSDIPAGDGKIDNPFSRCIFKI
jgi:hypothetical protein